MRKSLAWMLGAVMALSLSPMVSHAYAQCPGAEPEDPNAAGLSLGYKEPEVIRIRSGVAQVPDNPAYESGMVDIGAEVGCMYQVTSQEGVDARYLTPGATILQVHAVNYPDTSDYPPGLSCVKFGGTPSATCTASGDKKLTWSFEPFFPQTSPSFSWDSQVISIPSTATSVTACSVLKQYGAQTSQRWCTTYRTVGS